MENKLKNTPTEENYRFFSRAARIRDNKFRTEFEWETAMQLSGVKHFKRRALGLCGLVTVKSAEELKKILIDIKVASTEEEARDILPLLTKSRMFEYGTFSCITIDEVTDKSGEIAYKIRAYPFP